MLYRNILAATALIVLFAATISFAQAPIFVENFNIAEGALLTENGWTAHSAGGTNPIIGVVPGLTYSGYPGSGVGNAAGMTTSGEDVHRTFTVQSSGSVYAAFMVRVSEASTDAGGGYFFHLSPDPIGTAFRARVFAKKDASNNLSFGISKAVTTAADIAFTPFTYSLNTTYLIVVKYTIVDGTGNDTVAMYINPTLPGGEPGAPTVSATDTSQSDIAVGSVALRQGTAATHPTVVIDGIRIGTSWASITTATINQAKYVDFNGDGRTDYAAVRNIGGGGSGQIRWWINYTGSATSVAADWGIAGDVFVPEDFDGDGKSDLTVWRAVSTGQPSGNAFFYIFQSSNNTIRIEDFGQQGDTPRVVGDYDGDGKADVAVYRSGAVAGAQSFWYYRGSLNNPGGNITYVQWGQNGDFPASGDYDGDGKYDFVMQRNNGGGQARFWMLQTTAGIQTVVFGTPTDVIIPGDYDGDGKTDLAVIRGSGGQILWFVRPSSTGVVSATPFAIFGNSATDFPTAGDYDGDGKTDPAIWRSSATPGESRFWVRQSTGSVITSAFGQQGDYPVANFRTF